MGKLGKFKYVCWLYNAIFGLGLLAFYIGVVFYPDFIADNFFSFLVPFLVTGTILGIIFNAMVFYFTIWKKRKKESSDIKQSPSV
jgi:energy-coupling factor transporter transmembrane protein EcfT